MMNNQSDEKKYFDELKADISVDGAMLYAGRLLQRAASNYPDLDAIIFNDTHITYQQLYNRACALSVLLCERGLNARDRVIICFENSPDFYIAYYAVWQAGGVVAPVNTFLKETELAHIIKDAQPKFIITSSDRTELFSQAGADSSLIISEKDMPQELIGEAQEPIDLESNEMCALLYTSGTTGLPKGVMLSSNNIMTNVLQGVTRLQIGHDERLFGVLPLFHVFAQNVCLWGTIFVGATTILVSKIDRRLILAALKHEPTVFLGVPALYGLLCLLKTAPISQVKYFVSGGDALPDKIRTYFALLYRRKICNGYGLTETSPVIAVDLEDRSELTSTIGKPVVEVAIELRNEEGRAVSQGEIGELWVKGDNIMLGYYNAPEATGKVLKNGWFNTGDATFVNSRGKLVITGRTKDLIINKGINIYPQEIENVIMSHPNVLMAGVVGKPDGDSGEVPVAFVQLKAEEPDIANKLRALCAQQLAPYKVPREFICSVEELPTTATRKVDKKLLRKKLES